MPLRWSLALSLAIAKMISEKKVSSVEVVTAYYKRIDEVNPKLNAIVQATLEDPAIVKIWADTGVTPFPKDQRSPQAAQTLLHSEIVRWGQVIRDNKIQPQTD